jgi:MSHA biogenesis protein MshI
VLQFFKRKAQAGGLTGVSFGQRHFAIANVTRDRDQLFLAQCSRHEFRNPQNLRESLVEQIERLNLQGTPCNAVLAPRDYSLYLVEAPAVEPEEMRAAVRWKVKDLLDVPLDDVAIDIFPVPEDAFNGRNQMLYVVAAARSRVASVIELCRSAKLELAAIDIPEMAMKNISTRFSDERGSQAFIALKTNGSNMNITRAGALYLARTVNTQVPLDVMGTVGWGSLRDRLVLEIQRSLDYYESQMGQAPVKELLIAPRPDGAMLATSLQEVLPVKVSMLEYEQRLESSPDIDAETKHASLFAVGGALRHDLPGLGG